jgi:hypothetical protein
MAITTRLLICKVFIYISYIISPRLGGGGAIQTSGYEGSQFSSGDATTMLVHNEVDIPTIASATIPNIVVG